MNGLRALAASAGCVVVLAWASVASADIALTPAQMAISPSLFPIAEYTTLTTLPSGALHLSGAGDPIVGFQVSPTDTAGMAAPYQPLVDYSAILRSDGSIDALLSRPGSYMARVSHASGAVESVSVNANVGSYGVCFDGARTAFPCPTGQRQFVGQDVSGFDDGFSNRYVATSLAQMVQQICDASMEGNRDIVIADHGMRGSFTINGVDSVSKNPADAANLALFCTLSGKIDRLTLIACSAAAPNPGQLDDGHDFICMLSMCLGNIEVRGWETNIAVANNGDGTYTWSSANPNAFVKVLGPGAASMLMLGGVVACRRRRMMGEAQR